MKSMRAVLLVFATVAGACAERSGMVDPFEMDALGGVSLQAHSATLLEVNAEGELISVELQLNVASDGTAQSLAAPLFRIELDNGIEYAGRNPGSSCPFDGFVSAGARVQCAVVFEVPPAASPVALHYPAPLGDLSVDLPELVLADRARVGRACRSIDASACDCMQHDADERWGTSEIYFSSTCGGQVTSNYAGCDELTDISDGCAADVADLLEQSVAACTPCPTSDGRAQERAYAECTALGDALAGGDSSCLDCVIPRAAQHMDPSVCDGELDSSAFGNCEVLTDVGDACANAAADAFAAVRSACPTCP